MLLDTKRFWISRSNVSHSSGSTAQTPSVRAGFLVMVLVAGGALPQPGSVVSTVHNLSASGPGEIRALRETEVCKFCHVPHQAKRSTPLWGHATSNARYDVPEIRTAAGVREPAPQPNGSSRLCLSCHDGTVALGDVAGESRPIRMAGTDRLTRGRPGFLGTDLSGSHPVSFVVSDIPVAGVEHSGADMGLRSLVAIASDPDVHLDSAGRMQCTTCHDPHADRYFRAGRVPRFWVKPTIDEVCLACHVLR